MKNLKRKKICKYVYFDLGVGTSVVAQISRCQSYTEMIVNC